MVDAKTVNSAEKLYVELPMVQPTGKVRVKERSFFSEYGRPVATRSVVVKSSCYVEWQIGYDLLKKDENKSKTSLLNFEFKNYKGELKYLYELCEILYYSYQRGFLSKEELKNTYEKIVRLSDADTFEHLDSIAITRTEPKEVMYNDMSFYKMTVSYPLLVHRFGKYEIFAEIIVKEKQRAIGTQAMLYVCLPINSLVFEKEPVGRTLDKNETAKWVIQRPEAKLALELFYVFGMLSPKHKYDVVAIFKTMFDFL